jgi:Uma2 family endonuclease
MSAPTSNVTPIPPASTSATPQDKPLPPGYHKIVAELEELKRLMVADDGENMDTGWHYLELHLLVETIHQHFRGRNDYYAGANNFIYFSAEHVRNRDFRGPDFYFVDGVPHEPLRKYWCVWEERGRYPDLIIELLSSSTAAEDRGVKKDTYESVFRTPEFFCYDPDAQRLEAWRLDGTMHYQPIPVNERGWMWSERLGLWLGTWVGTYQGHEATWLRFFDNTGNPVFTGFEEAEAETQRAEAETQRAEAEKQRAEAEKQRADALAAEVVRLQALLRGT